MPSSPAHARPGWLRSDRSRAGARTLVPEKRAAVVLGALAVLATVLGVVLRARYALVLHHPRHFITSDAGELVTLAERLVQNPAAQRIGDTIWPPGAAALLAPLLALDPSLELAATAQVVLGVATFLLVGHTAYLVLGARAGVLALALASVHFGFIHYGGFFLSEAPFQFAMALSIWAAVAALARSGLAAVPGAARGAHVLRSLASGAAVGACFALAAAIRPNAVPVALGAAVALFVHAVATRHRTRLYLLAGGAASWLLLLTPLTWRCTRLSDRFCPVSNNLWMNVALGQAGEVSGLAFQNAHQPELGTQWVPPALLNHGYHGVEHVPFSIYDTQRVLHWVLERWLTEPGACLLRALGNTLDLFRIEWWPSDLGDVPERLASVAVQAFLLAVVIPGVVCWIRLLRASRHRGWSGVTLLFSGLVAGMLAAAAVSLGEPRYRIPFDGIFIVLASALYLSTSDRLVAPPVVRRGTTFALACAGSLALLLGLTIERVSAKSSAGLTFAQPLTVSARPTKTDRRPLAEYSHAIRAGSAWDASGNYVFHCHAACKALELELDGVKTAARVELGVDDNDRYEVSFWRHDSALGRADLLPGSRGGMQQKTIDVPAAARGGFDRLRITPLYGDDKYSLGHVQLLSP